MCVCARARSYLYEYRLRSSVRIRTTYSVQKEYASASYMQAAIHRRRSSSLVSIVSSSLARNRIHLSINTRNKVVNATIATTTKTARASDEANGMERERVREREREERNRNVAAGTLPADQPAIQQTQSFLNGPLIHRGQTVSRL